MSLDTLGHVIYADTIDTDGIHAAVELRSFEESELSTTEEVAFVALQGAGQEYFSELERKAQEAERLRQQELELERLRILELSKVKLSYNPFEKSNLTVAQYNTILNGTGLEGAGQSYYKMEQEYNVNGLYAVAVALHESGLGKYKANTNNFYGMRGSRGWMAFKSVDANIQYFGELMNKPLYKGKSIESIGKIYCPPTPESWTTKVKWFMRAYYNKI